MKNKIIILIVMIVLLVIGCKGGGNGTPITDINIYQGTEGLTLEFLQNMPAEKLLENEPFSIGLLIKNKGAFDINIPEEGAVINKGDKPNNGLISISVEEDYMVPVNYGEESELIELKGKSRYNIKGEQIIKRFDTKTKLIDPRSEAHTSAIYATACYRYQTKAVADVCVDTDIYNTKPGEKTCGMKTITLTSQGAPIAVTKIEQGIITKAIEGKDYVFPQFLIYIQNKGNGQVINQTKVKEACSASGIKKEDLNRLNMEAMLNDKPLFCEIKPLRLIDEEDYVRCGMYDKDKTEQENVAEGNGYDKSMVNSFFTPIKIVLDYGYTFTISKQVTIEKNR